MKAILQSVGNLWSREWWVDEFRGRILSQAPPWMLSCAAHTIIFIVIALLPYHIANRGDGSASSVEVLDRNQFEETSISHFELGTTPLDPTELNTESLMQWEAKPIAQTAQFNDNNPVFEERGGGVPDGLATGAGLGFDIKASGLGPALRGGGGVDMGAGFGQQAGRGGAGSGFGLRGTGNREAIPGVTKASERAVGAALNWIARHQNKDGSWSIQGGDRKPCAGTSCMTIGQRADAAATAMAILPFLGAGQTHLSQGPYQKNIQRGITWLIQHQDLEGDLSNDQHQMYSHGLATIALCEAYGMTKDSKVGHAAQSAIKFIESGQNEQGGWRYTWRSYEGDTSVFGWQVMALKSAQLAGLEVSQEKFDRCKIWLDQVGGGYHKGKFAYMPGQGPRHSMTAVGLLATEYTGGKPTDSRVQESVEHLLEHMPTKEKPDAYYWYYATLALHNIPGPEWEKWNRQMRRQLIDTQVDKGCATGSWNPADDEWGSHGGRLMVTSLSTLTLEVYYRYLPLYQTDRSDSKPATKSEEPTKSTE